MARLRFPFRTPRLARAFAGSVFWGGGRRGRPGCCELMQAVSDSPSQANSSQLQERDQNCRMRHLPQKNRATLLACHRLYKEGEKKRKEAECSQSKTPAVTVAPAESPLLQSQPLGPAEALEILRLPPQQLTGWKPIQPGDQDPRRWKPGLLLMVLISGGGPKAKGRNLPAGSQLTRWWGAPGREVL